MPVAIFAPSEVSIDIAPTISPPDLALSSCDAWLCLAALRGSWIMVSGFVDPFHHDGDLSRSEGCLRGALRSTE